MKRLQDERAGKDNVDVEVLRLRTELLKQQRNYWQATATLKDRFVRAPTAMLSLVVCRTRCCFNLPK